MSMIAMKYTSFFTAPGGGEQHGTSVHVRMTRLCCSFIALLKSLASYFCVAAVQSALVATATFCWMWEVTLTVVALDCVNVH